MLLIVRKAHGERVVKCNWTEPRQEGVPLDYGASGRTELAATGPERCDIA